MYFPIFLSLSTGLIPRLRQEVQILEFKKPNLLAVLLTNLGAVVWEMTTEGERLFQCSIVE